MLQLVHFRRIKVGGFGVGLASAICLSFLVLHSLATAGGGKSFQPYIVSISQDEATKESVDEALPIDPVVRIQLHEAPGMSYGLTTTDGKRLTFSSGSAQLYFRIDGRVTIAGGAVSRPLPPDPNGKRRLGRMVEWRGPNGLRVTQIQEIVPSRLPERAKPGQKRKMDTVLFTHLIENTGNKPVKLGMRVRMDTYNASTDGPVFAAPTTLPGKILSGVVVEGKDVPEYFVSMERGDFKNPGNQFYFSFKCGDRPELPSKLIPTRHGSPDQGWDVQPMPIMGDSDLVLYWEDRVLQPNEKREITYAYGGGVVNNSTAISLAFDGSFQPGKSFTVTAYIDHPETGLSLTLDLPAGMELTEGKPTQPVPLPIDDRNRSIVVWKGKVLRPGTFDVRVRSSNGIVRTANIRVQRRDAGS